MSSRPLVRAAITVGALTAAWCGLWRDVSPANLLVGAALGAAVTASGISPPGKGSVRIVPLAKLIGLVLVDLVNSTIQVAVEILSLTDRTNEAIVAVRVPSPCEQHLLLLVVAITLTPGTAVVEVDSDTNTLYLHLLHHDRFDQTEQHVQALARLACETLPTPTPERAA